MTKDTGPVLIELDDQAELSPGDAPPVPERTDLPPEGQAMQTLAALAARPRSRLAAWFLGVTAALIGFVASVWAWDFVTGLVARHPVLGYAALLLTGLFLLILLLIALREWAGFARLRRLDRMQNRAKSALEDDDLTRARQVVGQLDRLYASRDELRWARQRLSERLPDVFDAEAALSLADAELMQPIDKAALREVEAAARQVAMVTALIPLALADLIVALTANLRMIRRIAELYGGRSGTLGSWRLTRTVLTHLVATGAVAVTDDLVGTIAGGGVLSKLSRRFGEGLINGALTARVGIAAIEVCRPLPFTEEKKPRVTSIIRRALTGLFGDGAAR